MRDERLPLLDDDGGALAPREAYPEFAYEFGPRKHLSDHWRVVARRKGVILTLVVTALAISTVYTFRQPPLYRATTRVEIKPELANVLPYQDFERSSAASQYRGYLNTQIEHLTSHNLARRLALAAGLDRQSESRQEAAGCAAVWDWLTGSNNGERSRRLTREEQIQQRIGEVLGAVSVVPAHGSPFEVDAVGIVD